MSDSNTRRLLGAFLKQRKPDDESDPFRPIGESFVNFNLPNPNVVINYPSPPKPPKTLGEFKGGSPSVFQPAPPLSNPSPPWDPRPIPEPPRTMAAAFQPGPTTPLAGVSPEQLPHPESTPTMIAGFQPGPDITPTRISPEQPHPTIPLANISPEQLPHPVIPLLGAARAQPSQNPGIPLPIFPFPDNESIIGKNKVPMVPGDDRNRWIHQATPSSAGQNPRTMGTRYPLPRDLTAVDLDKKSQIGGNKTTRPLFFDDKGGVKQVFPSNLGQDPGGIKLPRRGYSGILDDLGDTNPKAKTSRLDPFGPRPTTLAKGNESHGGQSIKDKLRKTDEVLFKFLRTVGEGGPTDIVTEIGNPEGRPYTALGGGPLSAPGGQAWNPLLFAQNLVKLGAHMGVSGLVTFAAVQLGLHLLNPLKENAPFVSIWNPLVLANPPLLQNFIPSTINALIDQFTGGTTQALKDADIHKKMAEGNYNISFQPLAGLPPFTMQTGIGKITGPVGAVMSFLFPRLVGANSQNDSLVEGGAFNNDPTLFGKSQVQAALETRNFYNDNGRQFSENATFTLEDLIEEGITGTPGTLVEDTTLEVKRLRFPQGENLLQKFFFKSEKNPLEWKPKPVTVNGDRKTFADDPLIKSAFTKGIIPVRFKSDNPQGFILVRKGDKADNIIDDDEAYVPLSFTDLRPIGNSERSVYFRPFIKDLKFGFEPQWNETNFMGRVDPVATYQSTGRTISFNFEVHTFGPEDLLDMYSKLLWLESMVYPEVDAYLNYVSGPVIRLRIGDLVASSLGVGLPGIIKGLDIDFGGSLWELRKQNKLPRSAKISINFRVLHDRPIGRGADGKFGGIGTLDAIRGYLPPELGKAKISDAGKIKFPVIETQNAEGFASYPNINSYTSIQPTTRIG